MDLQPGYCLLSVWPHGVAASFSSNAAVGIDDRLVLRIIVMHELGHCVDMSRDAGSFADPRAGTRSVAPKDAAGVHDVASLYEAGRRNSTGQWREVYADLFAIGYARVTYPSISLAIGRLLSAERAAAAKIDPIHATSCWIDAASKASGPADLADLPSWADRQRSGASCPLAPEARK
jgi:hypothetical protein